jgi:pimeloyl-ACP methyl ester carboxylesterase
MSKKTVRLTLIAVLCLCVGPRVVAAQGSVELVPGTEFTAGANLTAKNVKADGTIFVPDRSRRMSAVIVLVESWPGADRGVYDQRGRKLDDEASGAVRRDPRRNADSGDLAVGRFRSQAWRRLSETCDCALLHLRLGTIRPEASAGVAGNGVVIRNGISDRVVRNAGAGGAEALLVILQRLGEESAHQELKDAPLLLWGWSAPANFATTFAELHPERTAGFIRYAGHLRGLSPNVKALRSIPALLIAGGQDEQAGTEDAETFWKTGRSAGAPWTFAIDPAATHGSEERFVSNHVLMIPWIAAVLRQRLEPGSTQLRPVTDDSGWLGNNHSAEVAPYAIFGSPKGDASWLPDEVTARGWQTVLGAAK